MGAVLPFPPRPRAVDDGSVMSAAAMLSDAGDRLAMLRRRENEEIHRMRERDRARQEAAWANDEPDGPGATA